MIKNIIAKIEMYRDICNVSTGYTEDKTLVVKDNDVVRTVAADIFKRILQYVSECADEAVSVPSVSEIMDGLNNKDFTFAISETISAKGGVCEDTDELFDFFITNETKESTRYDTIYGCVATYVAA